MSRRTRSQIHQDVMEHVAHNHSFGWATIASKGFPKPARERLLVAGLIEDAGAVALVDGDGFTIQPERYRQAWKLTPAGIAEVERLKAAPKGPNGYGIQCAV